MIYFTPGPSQLYPTVKKHIQQALREDIPSISHRGQKFQEIYEGAIAGLRQLLDIPTTHRIYFLSSGTEAMERVIENCVAKYSFHLVNGSFSKRFYKTALELRKKPQKYEVPLGEGFNFRHSGKRGTSASRISKNERDPGQARMTGFDISEILPECELICLTQNETSTGVQVPMDDVYALKKKHPTKLVALDIVSSAPYVDVDYKKLDLVFFSVQKGFGLPAGLAVIIVSPKAFAKAKKLEKKISNIGSYHSFLSLQQYAVKNQTPETPNVLGIYLLGKVIEDFKRVGIKTIRKETDEKAKLLYDFFESGLASRHSGKSQRSGDVSRRSSIEGRISKNVRDPGQARMTNTLYKSFVKERNWRSRTVIVAEIDGGSKPLIEKLKKKGFVVGSGYGELKERQIRIANFPSISKHDLVRLLRGVR